MNFSPTLNRTVVPGYQRGEVMLTILILGTLAVLGLLIWASVHETRKWEAFKVAHECKAVAYIKGSVGVGVSSSGSMVTTVESDKTGWQCNDGITYYR